MNRLSLGSSSTSERSWPIRMVDHRNIYSRILYDVEGNILFDEQGHRLVNAFRENMDDMFTSGRLRLMRNSTTKDLCYRYFIRDENQLHRFLAARQYGTNEGPNVAFHVYVDDDVDASSPAYKSTFTPCREQ